MYNYKFLYNFAVKCISKVLKGKSYPLIHIKKWIYPHILFDKVSKFMKNEQFLLKIAELSTVSAYKLDIKNKICIQINIHCMHMCV